MLVLSRKLGQSFRVGSDVSHHDREDRPQLGADRHPRARRGLDPARGDRLRGAPDTDAFLRGGGRLSDSRTTRLATPLDDRRSIDYARNGVVTLRESSPSDESPRLLGGPGSCPGIRVGSATMRVVIAPDKFKGSLTASAGRGGHDARCGPGCARRLDRPGPDGRWRRGDGRRTGGRDGRLLPRSPRDGPPRRAGRGTIRPARRRPHGRDRDGVGLGAGARTGRPAQSLDRDHPGHRRVAAGGHRRRGESTDRRHRRQRDQRRRGRPGPGPGLPPARFRGTRAGTRRRQPGPPGANRSLRPASRASRMSRSRSPAT